MIIAEIFFRTTKQILTHSYFKETVETKTNYMKTNIVEFEKLVFKEENKIRKKYGDNLVELKIRRFY